MFKLAHPAVGSRVVPQFARVRRFRGRSVVTPWPGLKNWVLGVAGTLARVLGGFAWFFPLFLLGAFHRAGHTASGLPRSIISAPVTPWGTGAPCTHVSHRIPFSNPIVFDSIPFMQQSLWALSLSL